MTREEILSIEGVEEDFGKNFIYKDIIIVYNEDEMQIESLSDINYNSWIEIKPISDIETLKQFLLFFEV
jgi:hypothetical protein